jgi:hypothetical protein
MRFDAMRCDAMRCDAMRLFDQSTHYEFFLALQQTDQSSDGTNSSRTAVSRLPHGPLIGFMGNLSGVFRVSVPLQGKRQV